MLRRAQARNLVERILSTDPDAKIVVHAGYGHTDEQGSGDWSPMARVFGRLTGIDPLTVNQTSMSEHSRLRYEAVSYREAVNAFAIDRRFLSVQEAVGLIQRRGAV